MDESKWVKCWLKLCHENNILPWKFDFKQFYIEKEITEDTSHLELWLKYKSGELEHPKSNLFTENLLVTDVDPDKAAFPIYNVLGWSNNKVDVVRGDSMNSFKTTFTKDIVLNPNYKSIYNDIGINTNSYLDRQYDVLLKERNYLKFEIIRNNELLIEEFAQATHCVGNYITIPYKLNLSRGSSIGFGDYWDITLIVLYDFLMSIGSEGNNAWKAFINKYYLQPFVNTDYSVGELWKGHLKVENGTFINGVYPKNTFDIEQFYSNVNLLIEERGKWMTKILCEKLDLTKLNFYKYSLKDKKKIRCFNEIINEEITNEV